MKTEDGYTLTIWHLTGDENGPWETTRNSVLFQHGMGGQALGWGMAIRKEVTPMAY